MKCWRRLSEARATHDKLKDAEEEGLRRDAMFFRLRPTKLWGDYGTVLMNGFACRDAASGQLLLDRAGPFAPPISFPLESMTGRCAVVTRSFRELLESAGLAGLVFTPVIKNRVVDIPWHTWNRLAIYLGVRPEGGEPKNLIEARDHSEMAAREMEELWELTAPGVICEVHREQSEKPRFRDLARFIIRPGLVIHQSLFSPSNNSHLWLVDEATRLWFEEHAGEWVQFDYVIRGE